MSNGTPQWTPEQLAGITTTGTSLLLSAAAGSGKTAVLTERVVHLVTTANPACEIDELLVVAFNEAAALELKQRIGHKLRSALVNQPTERLEKQVALADRAAISTLHAFCARLLRQHFHRVGLDPAFTVLDPDEARLLRQDLAYDIFARRYEADADSSFQQFIDDYGDGDDDRLVVQVLKIRELLTSVLDPDRWKRDAIDRLTDAAQADLADSQLGQDFLQLVREDLALLADKIDGALRQFRPQKPFAPYVPLLADWQQVVDHWRRMLDAEGIDTFAEEARSIDDTLAERLPAIRGDVPGKEMAKKVIDDVKKHLREGFCRAAGRFDQKQWRRTVEQTLSAARILISLVDELEAQYASAKSQQRAVDFADLERLALRVLSAEADKPGAAPSDVALSLQKRFKHVLVDEYQDINEVQDAILHLVSRESTASDHQPSNLFCVGDVKQSIYRFRLADPRRFIAKYDAFKSGAGVGQVIDLQANFRSRGPLLESLNEIFRRLMTRAAAEIEYDAAQELKPKASYPPPAGLQQFSGAPIELHIVPAGLARAANAESDSDDLEQDEYEAALVAQRILDLTGRSGSPPMQVVDRNGVTRDIQPGDIVVLLRSRKFTGERYAQTLRKWGIAAHADSGTGFFESQEIVDLMSLLTVLDNQQQDIPLAAVLRGPVGMLPSPEDDLAKIRLAYRTPRGIPFHLAVRKYADEQRDELAAHLRAFLAKLHGWRTMMHQRPVADVLRHIYDDAGLLTYYSGLPDGDQRVANLEELYRRSAQFGSFARQGLARFLRFLINLKDDANLGQPSLAPEGDSVVRIMTVHQSKGLEFPVVIMPNLGRRLNMQDITGSILADRSRCLGLHTVDQARQIRYPSLASLVLRDTVAAQMTAEEIRVMYVALTRAKEHLILIGSAREGIADAMKARWAGHVGPLPAPTIRAAMTPLDWLLPIHAAVPGLFNATWHDADAIKSLAARPGKRKSDEDLKPLAELRPLNPPPPPSDEAERVLAQLRYEYPHAAATVQAAARSVTSWTKNPAAHIVRDEVEIEAEPVGNVANLELPLFLAEDVQPKATDLGTFTHAVLEHLDFTQAADADAIAKQIAGLVDRRLLTESQAKTVDVAAVAWMMTTEVGRLLRDAGPKLVRELPLYLLGEKFPTTDPADKVMLRGRLDAYVSTADGGIVIDYKTDRVAGQALDDRAAFYAGQLKAYADAMTAITKQPTRAAYLVFLHARKVVAV